MRKDPTLFRLRFQRWKNGELVYDAGLPKYDDGKEPVMYQTKMPKSDFQFTDDNGTFHDASQLDLLQNWYTDMAGNPIVTNMPEATVTAKAPRAGLLTRYEDPTDAEQMAFNNSIRNSRRSWDLPLAALVTAPALPLMAGAQPAVNSAVSLLAPGTAGGAMIGNMAADMGAGLLLDKAVEGVTGKSFGLNVSDLTGGYVSPELGDFANPGYWEGGRYLTKGLKTSMDVIAATKNAIRKYNNLAYAGYTGVPHRLINGTNIKFMNDEFKAGRYHGDVWTADQYDYAKMFADEDGDVFKIYYDKNLDLLDTPHAPNGSFFTWPILPFETKNGNVIIDPIATTFAKESTVYPTKQLALKYNPSMQRTFDSTVAQKNALKLTARQSDLGFILPNVSTDKIVEYSKTLSKDGTLFHDVFDGGMYNRTKPAYGPWYQRMFGKKVPGVMYDMPINEVVLNSGTPYYFTSGNSSKISLFPKLWKQSFKKK